MTEPGPRTRASSVSRNVAGYSRKYNLATGVEVYNTPLETVYWTKSNHMEDVVVERYKERSAAGEVFNNPCLKIDTEVYYNLGIRIVTQPASWHTRYVYEGVNARDRYIDEIPDLYVSSEDTVQTAITAAATRAMAKVSSEAMLLGATLGELRGTKEMLLTAFARLRHLGTLLKTYRDVFQDIRHGPLWKTKKGYLMLENAWMEVRMGWRPFLGEVKTLYYAMNALANFPERQTFRAKESFTLSDADTYTLTRGQETFVYDRTYYGKFTVSAGVLAEQRYGGVPDTFGLTKFPQTVYELTRLSWCLDYFLNVGDLIAAYTPDSLWTPMISWVRIQSRETQTATFKSYYQEGYTYSGSLLRRTTVTDTYDRRPSPPIGLTFLPKLSWAKYIDSAIVARQQIQKTLRLLKGVKAFNRRR